MRKSFVISIACVVAAAVLVLSSAGPLATAGAGIATQRVAVAAAGKVEVSAHSYCQRSAYRHTDHDCHRRAQSDVLAPRPNRRKREPFVVSAPFGRVVQAHCQGVPSCSTPGAEASLAAARRSPFWSVFAATTRLLN